MSDDILTPDERWLTELYARERPSTAAIWNKVMAQDAAPPRGLRSGGRTMAVALFAATAVAAVAMLGIRGLHGGPLQSGHGAGPATHAPLPSCDLPVLDFNGGYQGRMVGIGSGIGTYTSDPPVSPRANPYGPHLLTWDAPLQRWVNTEWQMVSPDGSRWLYYVNGQPGMDGTYHLADASGSDRVVTIPPGSALDHGSGMVVGWLPQGVLYLPVGAGGGNYRWFDPDTGTTRDAGLPRGSWDWRGGDTLWQIKAPEPGTLVGYDVATGTTTTWFSEDRYLGPATSETPSMTSMGPAHTPEDRRRSMDVLAVDATGHPIVHLGTRDRGTPVETLYLDSPGHATVIDHGVRPTETLDPVNAVADAHGVWFDNFDGSLYLYRPGDGLVPVGFAPATDPQDSTRLAGPCS